MKTKVLKSISEVKPLFDKLPMNAKIDVLWVALDYMEQYNGRSKWYCICLAMGYEIENY